MEEALYFGSFNPPHNGHASIVAFLHEHYDFQQIHLVLSPQNPLKSNDLLLEEQIRKDMVSAWTETVDYLQLSLLEYELPRPSYTYLTLRVMRERHPAVRYAVVMGMDSLAHLHHWRNYNEILQYHPIYVYPREGFGFDASGVEALKMNPRAEVMWMDAPLCPLSSTEIRNLIREGKDIGDKVPSAVYEYIQNHAIYR